MARRSLIDVQHPFFRPMWRRIAVVVVCLGWSVFEFIGGVALWGVLIGGVGLFCAYEFFFNFHPDDDVNDKDQS